MRRCFGYLSVMMAVLILAGCEWESSDDDTWDDSMSWVDFSGTYRSPGGGAIVTEFDPSPGSSNVVISITGEVIGTADSTVSLYSNTLDNKPVVEGSLSITVGAFVFTDNGDGTLTGTAATDGTINYETGQWSIDLKGNIVSDGELIVAAYQYESGGTGGQVDPGTDEPIFSFTVTQTGNRLVFTASTGQTYTGKLHALQTPGGDESGMVAGNVVGNFEVTGRTSGGHSVKIVGSFTAQYYPPASGAAGGEMVDKRLNGTWIQEGLTADISGVGGSSSVLVGGGGTVAP